MEAGGVDLANAARLERDDLVHRKNAALLSEDEVSALRDAFAQIKQISADARGDDRGFFEHAGMHGVPYWDCPHHTPQRIFLPWHRAYLYRLEQALADRVEGVTLPWWDWTTTREIPGPFAEETAGGAPNPLYDSETLLNAGRHPRGRAARRAHLARARPGGLAAEPRRPRRRVLAGQLRVLQRRLREHPRRRARLGRRDDGQRRLRRVRPGLLGAPLHDRPHVVALAAERADERRARAGLGGPRARAVQPARARRARRQRARLRLRRQRDAAARRSRAPARRARCSSRSRWTPPPPCRPTTSPAPIWRSVASSTPAAPTRASSTSTTPTPTLATGADATAGYVGSFHVFGHGGCFGAAGHCEAPHERRRFDNRPLNRAIRMKKRLDVTDALRTLSVARPAVHDRRAGDRRHPGAGPRGRARRQAPVDRDVPLTPPRPARSRGDLAPRDPPDADQQRQQHPDRQRRAGVRPLRAAHDLCVHRAEGARGVDPRADAAEERTARRAPPTSSAGRRGRRGRAPRRAGSRRTRRR